MTPGFDRSLLIAGAAHGVVALVCLALLQVEAAPILGVHPAAKPLKFAVAIAAFLASMAALVPALSMGEGARRILSGVLVLTMTAEMSCIGTQALRGRRSHFNLAQPLDAALTSTMLVGIGVLLLAMGVVTVVALVRPLAQEPLLAAAWRAALLLFVFAAVSGFAMGGRGGHTVGAVDGGPGMAGTNWSTSHGDLRVSHFFALHALQALPLLAVVVAWLPIGAAWQWTLLAAGIGANVWLAASSWLQALAARSFG